MFASIFSIGACVPPAPDSIEEMMNYTFANFDQEPQLVQTVLDNLLPFLDRNVEDAVEGWAVNSLSENELGAAGVDGKDVTDIIGASAMASYRSDMDTVVSGVTAHNKDEIQGKIELFNLLSEDGERDCLLSGECESYGLTANQTTLLSAFLNIRVNQDINYQYRWIDYNDSRIFLLRMLNPTGGVFDPEWIAKLHQQYSIAVIFEDDEGVLHRMESFWVDTEISEDMDLDPNFVVSEAIRSIHDNTAELDDYFEENE